MTLVQKIKQTILPHRIKVLYHRVKNSIFPPANIVTTNFSVYQKYTRNKSGIEIGGPSGVFREELPLYQGIKHLDGCNFSSKTVWEGSIGEGNNYNWFEKNTGFQYISEASNLAGIADEQYDFLMASHCLEHCANVLKTVREWRRIVKKGGAILIIVPVKEQIFDHNRPVTSFEHLQSDFENNIDETDLTHLEEIVALHDLSMDLPAGTKDQFRARSLDNYTNRCLHHHVFNIDLLKKIYSYFDLEILDAVTYSVHHIILGVKK